MERCHLQIQSNVYQRTIWSFKYKNIRMRAGALPSHTLRQTVSRLNTVGQNTRIVSVQAVSSRTMLTEEFPTFCISSSCSCSSSAIDCPLLFSLATSAGSDDGWTNALTILGRSPMVHLLTTKMRNKAFVLRKVKSVEGMQIDSGMKIRTDQHFRTNCDLSRKQVFVTQRDDDAERKSTAPGRVLRENIRLFMKFLCSSRLHLFSNGRKIALLFI